MIALAEGDTGHRWAMIDPWTMRSNRPVAHATVLTLLTLMIRGEDIVAGCRCSREGASFQIAIRDHESCTGRSRQAVALVSCGHE